MSPAQTHIAGVRGDRVPVENQDNALRFYAGALGFTTLRDAATPAGGRFIELAPGQAKPRHGTPEYAGSAADQATRRALWAEHTLAQTQMEASRAERDAARRNALDEALAPLLEVAAGLRTGAQRDSRPPHRRCLLDDTIAFTTEGSGSTDEVSAG
jgi:hypothetical protein